MNDSGDSLDCASSNGSTTVASMPVAGQQLEALLGSVRSCGADSGRTIIAGWRSNVTTAERAPIACGQPRPRR